MTDTRHWPHFDLFRVGPAIREGLMRANVALAFAASATSREAIARVDRRMAELLTTGVEARFPVLAATDVATALQTAANSVKPVRHANHDASADEGLCTPWLDLVYALLAHADLELNDSGISPEVWLERTRRRFGHLALAEPIAAFATARPSAGAAIWAMRQLAREGRLPAVWDADWLANVGAATLLGPDPLSRDPRTDIPASTPHTQGVPVEAGITNVDLRCRVQSLVSKSHETIHGTASLTVVTATRGAHMSRFQEAAHEVTRTAHESLPALAIALLRELIRRHPATQSRVRIEAKRIVPTTAAMTGSRSSTVATETVEVHVRGAEPRVFHELGANVMNACPCTLAFSGLLANRALDQALGPHRPDILLPPTATHSQPGTLRLGASGLATALPDPGQIWQSLVTVAHLRQAVLKRADEHDLVDRVHRRPQFSEDLCREAAIELASRCRDGEVLIEATALLDESIHGHRVYARVRQAATDLWATP